MNAYRVPHLQEQSQLTLVIMVILEDFIWTEGVKQNGDRGRSSKQSTLDVI